MRKILTLSLAAALIGAGGTAYAQADRAPDRGPPMTRTEVEQRSVEAFARMDANDDGVLDQADRQAHDQEMQREQFDRIDADHSGGISFEEFAAVREQRQELRGERRGPGGPRLGMRGGPGGPGMARAADTDHDGTVTQAEFASAALARFDRIDADKDGTIGADERPAPRRMIRRMMRRAPDAG